MSYWTRTKKKCYQYVDKISQNLDAPLMAPSALLSFALLFSCLVANISIRLFPAFLPQLKTDALFNVVNRVSEKMLKESISKNGTLPAAFDKQIKQELATQLKEVDAEYQKLKGRFQDSSGQTYLLENDPYAWAQWTQNIVKNGHPGDKKVNGKSYDSYMLAPHGTQIFYFNFLFYLSAFIYQGLKWIFPSLLLCPFLFYVPVFYTMVFLLLFYFFAQRWFSRLAAFFATFLAGLAPVCLSRSMAGNYDFDILSLIMPLLVGWCLLEAFERKDRPETWILFSLAAAFFQGLFVKTWSGWSFMLAVCAGFFIVNILSDLIEGWKKHGNLKKEIFPALISAAIFFIFSWVFAYLFTGENIIKDIAVVKKITSLFGSAMSGGDIWPNTYYTVSELGPLSLKGIAVRLYGKVIFSFALFGMLTISIKEWRSERKPLVVMMLCWFAYMFMASLKANRFLLYLPLPLFLFMGVFMGDVIPRWIFQVTNGLKRLILIVVFLFGMGFLVHRVFASGIAVAETVFPGMDNEWYQALTEVDQKTPKDAILNAWWDDGSWFRYFGKRRVIFDAQSQGGQLAYWMAKVLTGDDEAKVVAILRMLNNNSDSTFDELRQYIQDPFRCEKVLEDLLTADERQGRRILERNHVPPEAAQKILGHLYGKPAPAYFIVEPSLLPKISSISFLANWDFQKLFLSEHRAQPENKSLTGLRDIFALSQVEAEKVYKSALEAFTAYGTNETLSQRYGFYYGTPTGKKQGRLLYFDNGVVFDLDSKDVLFYSEEERAYRVPTQVIIYEGRKKKEFKNDKGDYHKTVVLVHDADTYQTFIADEGLTGSLLVKLYFLGGKGLKHFKPFYTDEKSKIYIYEILW